MGPTVSSNNWPALSVLAIEYEAGRLDELKASLPKLEVRVDYSIRNIPLFDPYRDPSSRARGSR
jgi:hypothetical protein